MTAVSNTWLGICKYQSQFIIALRKKKPDYLEVLLMIILIV